MALACCVLYLPALRSGINYSATSGGAGAKVEIGLRNSIGTIEAVKAAFTWKAARVVYKLGYFGSWLQWKRTLTPRQAYATRPDLAGWLKTLLMFRNSTQSNRAIIT